jgi:vacuolar-type H+-ATPase subunit I/STV1
MSLTVNTNLLVILPKVNLENILKDLIYQKIKFEILNPVELGDNWKEVVFLGSDKSTIQSQNKNLELLSSVLNTYSPFKGLSKAFVDNRASGKTEEIENIQNRQTELLQIADLLERYKKITTQEQEKEELLKELKKLKIDPNSLTSKLYREFALLSAHIELKLKISHLKEFLFNSKDTHIPDLQIVDTEHKHQRHIIREKKHCFGIFSIPQNQLKSFTTFLNKHNLLSQEIAWKEDIVDWRNGETLTPFQNIAQSLGTISKKEFDPSSVVAISFSTFFAFCLADAVYGILLTIFTGYFLFFTKIKQNLKSFFGLFFYSGLATTFFGIFTNSWAGNIFLSEIFTNFFGDGVDRFLVNFQLIDILNPTSDVPVNNFLRENGNISPVIVMLGVSVLLGFISLITAYIINIINSLKSKNKKETINQSAYLAFIFSIVIYIFAGSINPILASIAPILLIISLIAVFIFNNGKGVMSKIGAGLFGKTGIYSLVEVASNLLSFTRLVSTGLTGGIVATVINLLAWLIYESAGPILGIPLALVMLVVGHTFNLAISLFSSYLNPLRLHYVEFMQKFYQGGATQTKPYNVEFSHLNLK